MGAAGAKAPKACLKALAKAEQITQQSAGFATVVSTYFGELSAASSDAAATGDIVGLLDEQTAASLRLNDKIDAITAAVTALVRDYNRLAARCRRA